EGGPTHAIPPTIHALIAARLDRLPTEERAVLASAAVAGKHFVRSALRKLHGDNDESVVDTSLLSLARKDLLAARPGRDDAYRFRHVLIRDAAYAGIPKELRARLDLSRELGLALWSLGEVARAEALLNGIVAAAAAAGDKREEWYALLEQSAMRGRVDPSGSDDALEVARQAIEVFDELGDEHG